jgi:TonB family protein
VTPKAADSRLREALRGIQQPPEVPDYRPAPIPARPVPTDVEVKPQESLPSLTDLARRLENVRRPPPKPAVAATPKPAAKPATTIQVAGDVTGLTRYLALVQSRISEQWVAPPVDVTGRSYQVVIKFRLHRSGRITDVVVERESGNGYYDDAGKRAVLSVGSLPPFPPYVAEEVFETHFSFTVGEEVG